MKHKYKLHGFLVCMALSMILSCTPEKEKETNTLVGTKWISSYGDHYMVIEFTSEKQVQAYFTKGDAVTYERGLTNGSYSLSGSNVTFNNLDLVWAVFSTRSHYKPLTGTISGSIMKTQGQQAVYSDNDWIDWNETWTKQ